MIALALAATCGTADAAVSSFPVGRYAIGTPHAAGSAVVWIEPANPGYRVRLRRAGQTVTAREARRRLVTASLAASPQGLLVQESAIERGIKGFSDQLLESGTFSQYPAGSGPFIRRSQGCLISSPNFCDQNSAIDDANAFIPDPSDSYRAQVISLTDPGVRRVVEGVGSPVAIAGSKVAWVTPNGREVVVYDWQTERTIYRIPYPPGGADSSLRFSDLALQPDGTVAFAYPVITPARRYGAQYGWASPAQPTLHRMPIAPAPADRSLVLEGGRITFTRRQRDTPEAPVTAFTAPLGGRARALVAGVTNPATLAGGRLTWSERTCSGTRIASAPLEELEREPARRVTQCNLRLARPLRADRRGRVTFQARCEGFDRRCGFGILKASPSRRYGRGPSALRRSTAVFRALPVDGTDHRPVYQLTRRAQQQLKRRKRLSIRIRASVDFDIAREARFVVSAR